MLLSASLHRSWYTAGDTVRADISLHALLAGHGAVSRGPLMQVKPVDNYFTETDTNASSAIRVKTLAAQIFGICITDSRRIQYALEGERAAVEKCRSLVLDSLPKNYRVDRLFCSDEVFLLNDIVLCERETKALVLTFVLPEHLPSSFSGQCVRFYYTIHLHGIISDSRDSSGIVKLRVPIKIFSPQAVITPLLIPPYFPLEKFDFRVKVFSQLPAPSPAVTGPLQSCLVPSEVELFHVSSLRRKALQSLSQRLAKQQTPLEFPLRLGGKLALTVAVMSTTVMLGDSLKGVFVLHSNPNSQPVRATGSLEFLECCSTQYVKKGISCYLLPGEKEDLAVVQTTVVEKMDFVLIDRTSVEFFVPLTNLNSYASMLTDVVTTYWQFRLTFLWCKCSELQHFRERRREELVMEEEKPELILPLIVVPPLQTEQQLSSKGVRVQVLC